MYRFNFSSQKMPTEHSIAQILRENGWLSQGGAYQFSDANLRFDNKITQDIEYKHYLAELISQYCPDIAPLTVMVDESNYMAVYQCLKDNESADDFWILKPALLNNGEGIKLFESIEDLPKHYRQNKRYDGAHVLQKYIHPPHLLNNHKYSLRMFVVLTNFSGAYLYKDGYFNICRAPYDIDELSDYPRHITNEHLSNTAGPNNYQIPTARCQPFTPVYNDMVCILKKLFNALNEKHSLKQNEGKCLAVTFLGADFMLDEDLNTYLIEVNHGPCFPKSNQHALYDSLYHPFWQAVYDHFILPIAERDLYKQPKADLFQPLL